MKLFSKYIHALSKPNILNNSQMGVIWSKTFENNNNRAINIYTFINPENNAHKLMLKKILFLNNNKVD